MKIEKFNTLFVFVTVNLILLGLVAMANSIMVMQ